MDYQNTTSLPELASLFSVYNLKMVEALMAFRAVRREMIESTDETTGKAISAAKADVLADATPEAHSYETARAHTKNIETIVEALKYGYGSN